MRQSVKTGKACLFVPREKPAAKIRTNVFVYESTQMAADLLSHAIERSRYNLGVVGTVCRIDDANLPSKSGADVVVISASLAEGPLSGFTLLRRLLKANHALRCVMLLDNGDRDLVVEAFRSGALGVCERSQHYELLCKCIHSVHTGQIWANSQQLRYVLEALIKGVPSRATGARGELLLTPREDEIVSLVTEGLKNREIAQSLGLSEHTVKNHLFRIFEKLGISNRAELILYLLGNRGSAEGTSGRV